MKKIREVPEAVSAYMADIGAKGGKKGLGKKKKRTAAHYKRLVEIREKNREKRRVK